MQIEPTELFKFDKEVVPILDILTTRALETVHPLINIGSLINLIIIIASKNS
jgi:hypothetical protein